MQAAVYSRGVGGQSDSVSYAHHLGYFQRRRHNRLQRKSTQPLVWPQGRLAFPQTSISERIVSRRPRKLGVGRLHQRYYTDWNSLAFMHRHSICSGESSF
ncbi:hypothetical protein CsSME_00002196 [Camellia sinensis var. sinensis]|uniref:Uncharacterized protein n=1 Tax=Camellia sinensis TaxID=4442 RepID=A0A7J7I728_CAMSI|nr:hypothetical protein HYC85_001515 [Camellia sinensis]